MLLNPSQVLQNFVILSSGNCCRKQAVWELKADSSFSLLFQLWKQTAVFSFFFLFESRQQFFSFFFHFFLFKIEGSNNVIVWVRVKNAVFQVNVKSFPYKNYRLQPLVLKCFVAVTVTILNLFLLVYNAAYLLFFYHS